MRIELTNIGMIKSANIELPGLTVIAGPNDVGKSTVGKVLFAIVRAFNKYEEDFESERAKLIEKMLYTIYFDLRRIVNFDKQIEFAEEFTLDTISQELSVILDFEESGRAREKIGAYFRKKISILETLPISDAQRFKCREVISKILPIIDLDSDSIDALKLSLNKTFYSEFDGQMNSLTNDDDGLIMCSESDNRLFELIISEEKVKRIRIFDEIFFKDVTYIESPLVIQFPGISSNVFNSAGLLKVPQRTQDLLLKLQMADVLKKERQFSIESLVENLDHTWAEIMKNVQEIVQGDVVFDTKKEKFIYKKSGQKETLDIVASNIASGIKSLGILQMLIQAGLLDSRSLLIIDEPEVHLHPEWQVEYAKVIIAMVKQNIPVLINTHSPYMLQALKYYSDKANCQHLVKFYLADVLEGETGSTFEDVTEHLSKVFQKLSEPLQRLVWYDYGAQ